MKRFSKKKFEVDDAYSSKIEIGDIFKAGGCVDHKEKDNA